MQSDMFCRLNLKAEMAVLDLAAAVWNRALGIAPGHQPVALVLEGTWWRERATHKRLARLTDVQETAFPDIFLGRHHGLVVAYCCAYGAARAVEPAQIFAQMGTPLVIQIGTCGAMDAGLATGTVMVPDTVAARDGLSHLYGAGPTVALDPCWSARARALLAVRAVPFSDGFHLTWPSLFAQSDAMSDGWAAEGLRTVDMETSAIAAVAQHFGVRAIAMLTVWDALSEGKSFLDPLLPQQSTALAAADDAIFDVALDLAAEVGRSQAA